MPTHLLVFLTAAAALLVGVAAVGLGGGWSHEGVLEGVRLTARLSFLVFLTAWSASSLARLFPGALTARLLRRRRAVGLSFAASHFVHAGFFLTAIVAFGQAVEPITVAVGGLAYVFIAAMAITSTDRAVRVLGRRWWKLLHATGGWLVLLIFANSYVGRLGEKPWLALPALLLLTAAIGLRIAAFAQRRLARARPA